MVDVLWDVTNGEIDWVGFLSTKCCKLGFVR